MASGAALIQELATHLQTKSLHATPAWLNKFVSAQRASTPLPAVKQTALFRILASDIRQTLQTTPTSCFPTDVLNASIKERRLAGPLAVQVVDVEDMGKSRWSQVEEMEAAERGETTKGREIIRVVPGEDAASGPIDEVSRSAGPHKLTLQDAKGTTIFAVELVALPGVGIGMNIGTKLILRNVAVARGVALLDPESTLLLGGKNEALHKAWKEGRKEALKSAIPSNAG